MARKGEGSELPSVAELVNLSQTKPLMIRGELDAKLAEEPEPAPEPQPDPLAILDAELAAPEPEDERPRDTPPADTSRRTKPFILAAGGVVALGLAAVVLLQPHQVGGTAVPPPGASASVPPPASSEAVETLSASAAPPPLTAEVRDSPAKKPSAPAGAGRKPAGPATAAPPPDPQDQWREYVSSVISSWQQRPHGGRDR
ncbi:hypothetical protein [Amycolatopsis eburnea]|uniref:Uncharacterized protein n=1 Tax=Amycolatopsis eburnea TaxID=2267691 RepID=A0A427T4W0_9PSEU|nr:hypothetical protein [Amycolatopsis eburnea]RSD13833.1 hypothetical protein EIY87_29580 [Amycolatopsis eburnea]